VGLVSRPSPISLLRNAISFRGPTFLLTLCCICIKPSHSNSGSYLLIHGVLRSNLGPRCFQSGGGRAGLVLSYLSFWWDFTLRRLLSCYHNSLVATRELWAPPPTSWSGGGVRSAQHEELNKFRNSSTRYNYIADISHEGETK